LLSEEGIESTQIRTSESRTRQTPGVRLATMHRLKGLEFQAVAVVDVSADSVPSKAAVADNAFDPVQHDRDVQREKCVLYVACTRARDRLAVSWNGAASEFLPV
jgi:superfamily I DNA/RNA helicase